MAMLELSVHDVHLQHYIFVALADMHFVGFHQLNFGFLFELAKISKDMFVLCD